MSATRSSDRPRRLRRRPLYARARVLYPFAWHTPVLVVPGLHDSGPGHWQTHWEARFPELVRVVQDDFARPDLDAWAAAIAAAVEAAPAPPILVAHSFGCLATVRAAYTIGDAIAGVLFVAPADPARFGIEDPALAATLPFPSTLVASRNDPWLKFIKAGALAARWGSRFVDAGHAGHINADSGHGAWPEGQDLLRDVAERAAAAGTLRTRAVDDECRPVAA
ncbi:MAG: alpha/beta hydrolase [Burkholderiales bacterium]